MKVGTSDLPPDVHPAVQDIIDSMASTLNNGKYSLRVDSTAPTTSASDESTGEARLVYEGGALRLYVPAQGSWWYIQFTQA